jgi:hypothetical protein
VAGATTERVASGACGERIADQGAAMAAAGINISARAGREIDAVCGVGCARIWTLFFLVVDQNVNANSNRQS